MSDEQSSSKPGSPADRRAASSDGPLAQLKQRAGLVVLAAVAAFVLLRIAAPMLKLAVLAALVIGAIYLARSRAGAEERSNG